MAKDSPVVTGYYRYTDIWFEWHQALPNPEDARSLKAILAHDALVRTDHPLHEEGFEGMRLYMGTFLTGESRLLFSSAQVDYIRYWLHATQLTKDVIPLPYSDCLLTESNLRNVSRVTYPDGFSLRNAIKKIDKNNKRLKGSNPLLTSRRDLFERVRTFWGAKAGVWCAIDFEAWELEHTLLTEFGWSSSRWNDGNEIQESGHLIVDEHQKYRNTRYLKDWRYNYSFGKSEVVKKSVFRNRIQNMILQMSQDGPLFLVFHDNNQDIKYLKSTVIEAPLEGLSYVLPDAMPNDGIFVVDTSDLFAALEGQATNERRGLERVCNLLQIPTEYLHNAGNDAYYTLQAMKVMADGDPVDMQREKRWPNRTEGTTRGVKVQFHPWEEDSDWSDQEGVFPPLASQTFDTGGDKPVDESV